MTATVISPASGLQAPHFVEGSDRIFAHRSGTGLVSMRWDGTDVREHVQVRGAELRTVRRAEEGEKAEWVRLSAAAKLVKMLYEGSRPSRRKLFSDFK